MLFLIQSTLSIHSFAQSKVVIAQKGDGIYSLLKRYGYSISASMDSFIVLNKNHIGKNNTLFAGVRYKLPDKKGTSSAATAPGAAKKKIKTVRYAIFGKKYADVEITGNELKGALYYLVGGHGGPDPGAVGKHRGHQICEDEYAYDVILRLARNLISKGATVYLITRDKNDGIRDESYLKADKDEVCYPDQPIPLSQLKRLRQRTNAVNRLYKKHKGAYQRMIVAHVDSRGKKENIDVFFYYDKRSKTGKKTANILKNTFEEKYKENQPGRGYRGTVSTRNLYVVRNTYPPAVFIELGNMNHQRDIRRLVVSDNRQALANWLTIGLEKDFKMNR